VTPGAPTAAGLAGPWGRFRPGSPGLDGEHRQKTSGVTGLRDHPQTGATLDHHERAPPRRSATRKGGAATGVPHIRCGGDRRRGQPIAGGRKLGDGDDPGPGADTSRHGAEGRRLRRPGFGLRPTSALFFLLRRGSSQDNRPNRRRVLKFHRGDWGCAIASATLSSRWAHSANGIFRPKGGALPRTVGPELVRGTRSVGAKTGMLRTGGATSRVGGPWT